MSDLKKIRLIPDQPFYNNVEVAICDFGGKDGALRKRGKITVDYSSYDIKQLKSRGYSTLEEAMDYYRKWIYDTTRYFLLYDLEMEEEEWKTILDIIREKIQQYY